MAGFFNVDAVQQKNGADSHLIVDVHNENAHRFEKLKRRIPPQMERMDTLISILGKCVPELNTAPLYANLPAATDQISIVDWMYEHLSEQGLMVYEEWKEYFGHVPELKVLSEITFSEEPADFVYSLIEKIDWSTATIDPFEITYSVPWLEYINHFLAPEKLRVVDLWPFENAFIFCVHDDVALLEQLDACLKTFEMGIDWRPALDKQQVIEKMDALVTQ